MAVFTHDCPHCGAHRAAFNIGGCVRSPMDGRVWNALGTCPACHNALAIKFEANAPHWGASGPMNFAGDLGRDVSAFTCSGVWPRPRELSVPEHIPERVARAFKEGCDVLAKSPSSACSQFRKALEWGLKDLAPEVEAWKLEKRIDKLASEGKLTQSLKEWAHQLRIDGNEAVHGEEDPTREHAQAIELLTRYVLMYLYSLPKSVELARAAEGT